MGKTGSDDGVRAATPAEAEAGIAFVRPYLEPAFQLQRAGGERYVAADYVPPDFDAVEVSNVVTTQPRPDMRVMRHVLSTPGATVPDAGAVLADDATPQLADGRGWPTADGDEAIEWEPARADEVRNPAITRNGDLLVASCDAVASDITIEGRRHQTLATPRRRTIRRRAWPARSTRAGPS